MSYSELIQRVAEINDVLNALSVLTWDARTQMPPAGAETRGYQLATLTDIARRLILSRELKQALEAAEREASGEPPDSIRARTLQQVREAVEVLSRIPEALMGRIAALKSTAQAAWGQARAANDFSRFRPYLEQMLELNRQLAEAIGYAEHPYDALLLQYEPGMTARGLKALLDELKSATLPMVQAIAEKEPPRWDFLTRDYPEDLQRGFALGLAQQFGYDLSRGRLDTSLHPFEISFTRQDVRITTRYRRDYLPMGLFGVLHETGHALYEQGVSPKLTRSALSTDFLGLYAVGGASFGAHESQSRLWENLVGRSLAFWRVQFPALRATFPTQLQDVDAEGFYRAVNRVTPSLIRVEADELTYNFHILLRVELELALLEGSLAVRDLPEAWNAKMRAYLGLEVPSDTLGVLQDIHWSTGYFGSFPTYTLGNLMSAQFFAAAREQVEGLEADLAQGRYTPLLQWLQNNIYQHGRRFTPQELLVRSTGSPLTLQPYLAYLREKYGALYGLGPQGA
ncbi:MAG: carboxypeptidase M32 [Thermaceae bacterium]|nr:carboxypeptidase M32 [Thermaceae bacterium]